MTTAVPLVSDAAQSAGPLAVLDGPASASCSDAAVLVRTTATSGTTASGALTCGAASGAVGAGAASGAVTCGAASGATASGAVAFGAAVSAAEPGRVAEQRGSDFAGLSRQIRSANLLKRRRIRYSVQIGLTLLGFLGSWLAFVLIGDSWYQIFTAVVCAIFTTQVAFMGHDGGHQQVCRTRRGNDILGLVAGDLLVGLSFGWWLDKHNKHHSHPNHEGKDPDIGDGVFSFTTNSVAGRQGWLSRKIVGHQAWLFFPLLTLEGLHLHLASVRSILAGKSRKYRRTEMALLVVHAVVYLGGVAFVLSPAKALVFLAIHQGLFGFYMGCSFAPNHKGMAIVEEGQELDFLRRQVLTSRNVDGSWFNDLLLGGLNYQIEHHLFPNMPRPSLRKAQFLVQSYCAEHSIPYTQTTLFGSYRMALRHLHDVGRPLRRSGKTAGA